MGLSQYGEIGGFAGVGELGDLGGIFDVFKNIRNGVVAIATRIKARVAERRALAEGKTPEEARAIATVAATATGKEAAAVYTKRVSDQIAASAPSRITPAKVAIAAVGVVVVGGAIHYLTKK